jgi:proline iminopeptidase
MQLLTRLKSIMHKTEKQTWNKPHFIATARGAKMAYRDYGLPYEKCWLLLHGGPGGSAHQGMLQPIVLGQQRAILPDQRGAGLSQPNSRIAGNNTHQLVADLELLRIQLGVDKWSILSGSWGTVLALRYAQAYPQRIERMVMRGAFALKRAEIFGLLRPLPSDKKVARDNFWPQAPYAGAAQVLTRLEQQLRAKTLGPASRHTIRCWNLLELRSALQGLRRSQLHLAGQRSTNPQAEKAAAVSARQMWAQMQRQQRRALASLDKPLSDKADIRGWKKFKIQGHYLRHKGFVRPGELDAAVRSLAINNTATDWVHGRFDSVCKPTNSLRWLAIQEAIKPGLAVGHWPVAGHLASESGISRTLKQVVQNERY